LIKNRIKKLDTDELVNLLLRSKFDLEDMAQQCGEATGQKHAVLYAQWEIELGFHDAIMQELETRGRVQ